jgi:hypothetical protein
LLARAEEDQNFFTLSIKENSGFRATAAVYRLNGDTGKQPY